MNVEVPEYAVETDVAVDPDTSALLIVDMQNDFVREDGKLPVPTAAATIPAIRRLIEMARDASMRVFYTQDTHEPGDPEFAIWGEHVLIDTPGWEIVDELRPDVDRGDRVFRKDRYDGFFRTGLDEALREAGIESVIVCGTVANICVHYTAASAALRWYRVILPIDATSALTDFDMQASIRQTAFLFQGIITTADAIRAG